MKDFLDNREIFKLSPEFIEQLSASNEAYDRYVYGQCLYYLHPDSEASLMEAKECFEFASAQGVADATQMLSLMNYYGEIYKDGVWVMDRKEAARLNSEAIAAGSELAKLRRNCDLFWGNGCKADRTAAIIEAENEASASEASLLWSEQLGWYYEAEGRTDEAIQAYERCIDGGLNEPLYDLALIYYKKGNIAYFESLMEEGIEKGLALCMLWGFEDEGIWDELSQEQQKEIHTRLAQNLPRGVRLGSGLCAYALASYKLNGALGFEKNREEALEIAHIGVSYHNADCCGLILDNMPYEKEPMLLLKALRYGDYRWLGKVLEKSEEYRQMGYAEEIKFWEGD